jgi:hypothetical protein
LVDVLLIKDLLCGTRARPCPKYPGHEAEMGLNTAPDVFLFPQRAPTLDDPEPAVHTLQSLQLPIRILSFFGIPEVEQSRHVWEVRMKFVEISTGRFKSVFEVVHQDRIVDSGASKAWEPRESR